ncbi:MAG: ABC transporter permease [Lutisporaceae bacterium]
MKKYLTILKYSILQNALLVVISVVFSIAMCLIFLVSYSTANKDDVNYIKIGLVDKDNSAVSESFTVYLQEQLPIEIVDETSNDSLHEKLVTQSISAIFYIPKDFEKNALIDGRFSKLKMDTLNSFGTNEILKLYTNSYMNGLNQLLQASNNEESVFHELLKEYSEKRKISQVAVDAMGQEQLNVQKSLVTTVGFLPQTLMAICLCLSLIIINERQGGIYNRISVAPVKFYQYILGTSFISIIAAALPILVLLGFLGIGAYDIGISTLQIFLVMLLFALFMVCVSFLAGLSCNSQTEAFMVVVSIGSVGSLIGGCFFDVSTTPKVFQYIAMLTPHYWLMQGLRDSMNIPGHDMYRNIIVLLIFVVITFILTAIRYNKKSNGKMTITM